MEDDHLFTKSKELQKTHYNRSCLQVQVLYRKDFSEWIEIGFHEKDNHTVSVKVFHKYRNSVQRFDDLICVFTAMIQEKHPEPIKDKR